MPMPIVTSEPFGVRFTQRQRRMVGIDAAAGWNTGCLHHPREPDMSRLADSRGPRLDRSGSDQ